MGSQDRNSGTRGTYKDGGLGIFIKWKK